ncbi:MAG: hypothetical protein ACFFBD_22695 [Candidatus Hodarchaeota archaeon]
MHRRIRVHQVDQLERLVNAWLTEVTTRQEFHLNTKITRTIDLYQQPYYGDFTKDCVTGMERKKGAPTMLFLFSSSRLRREPNDVL